MKGIRNDISEKAESVTDLGQFITCDVVSYTDQPVACLAEVSQEEVKQTIIRSPSKSCDIDSAYYSPERLCGRSSHIHYIYYKPVTSGTFRDTWKCARITPLLKKEESDLNVY